jgi:hypothetical protein
LIFVFVFKIFNVYHAKFCLNLMISRSIQGCIATLICSLLLNLDWYIVTRWLIHINLLVIKRLINLFFNVSYICLGCYGVSILFNTFIQDISHLIFSSVCILIS